MVIAEFNISEVSQMTSCLTDVQRRVERAGDVVNDVARSASEGDVEMTRIIMGACEVGGVGGVW